MGVLIGLVAFRRWRHLFTFLASIMVMQLIAIWLYHASLGPAPTTSSPSGGGPGSSPSPPVVVLAAVLVAVIYGMVPSGRADAGKKVVAVVLAVVVGARLYLAVDHPFDALSGLVIGIAFLLAAFRLFTPTAWAPVTYRRQDRPPRRERAAGRRSSRRCGTSSASPSPRPGPWGWRGPAARRRCGCGWRPRPRAPARPPPTCSPSSSP